MKKFIFASVLVSLLLASPLIMAQNMPELPSLGSNNGSNSTKNIELPELPKLPEAGKNAELPKLEDIATKIVNENTEKKPEESAQAPAELPEISLPEVANSGDIIPAIPQNNLSNLSATAPAPAAIASELPAQNIDNAANNSGMNIEPSVNLAPANTVSAESTNEQTKQNNINSVLNDVFGEEKPKQQAEIITLENQTNSAKNSEAKKTTDSKITVTDNPSNEAPSFDNSIEPQAEAITEEKIITSEEVQALEAESYETDALDFKKPSKSYEKNSYKPKSLSVNKFQPSDFKSSTYSDSQLGNQLVQEAMRGNKENAISLISAGVSVNSANENMQTPLMGASFSGNDDMLNFLLSQGANVNAKDKNGNSALLIASSRNNIKLVQKLVSAGADVNIKNNVSDSPLLVAINSNNAPLAQLLINAGAEINTANSQGLTPLHIAAYSGNDQIVQALLNRGANKNAATRQGLKAYDIALNRNPNIAGMLAPSMPNNNVISPTLPQQTKFADASTQLSMFPKELAEPIEEPTPTPQQGSGWWGEQYIKNGNQKAQKPQNYSDVDANDNLKMLDETSDKQTITQAANYGNAQNVPASLKVSPVSAMPAEVTQSTLEAPTVNTSERAISYAPTTQQNSISNTTNMPTNTIEYSTSNAPSVPVSGLTKVTYEAGRTFTEIKPIQAAQARTSNNTAQTYATSKTTSQPQITKISEPVQTTTTVQTTTNVPMSFKFKPASQGAQISQPANIAATNNFNTIPESSVEAESNLELLAPNNTESYAKPSTKTYTQNYVANTTPASIPVNPQAILPVANNPAPQVVNATPQNSPIRNLKSVDYASFYNNGTSKVAATTATTKASIPATLNATSDATQNIASSSNTSSELAKTYVNMQPDEQAKWNLRLRQWKQAKASGTSSPEMLTKQERILRVIYKEQFNSAVAGAQ